MAHCCRPHPIPGPTRAIVFLMHLLQSICPAETPCQSISVAGMCKPLPLLRKDLHTQVVILYIGVDMTKQAHLGVQDIKTMPRKLSFICSNAFELMDS